MSYLKELMAQNDPKQKGDSGETMLNDWFLTRNLPYVAVCQSPSTFSNLFSAHIKRPDFLLLMNSLGLIAVDAKNYTLSGGVYTLELEEELRRSVSFERLLRIPVWYAYCDHSSSGQSWFWISALKALEVGEVRKNKAKNTEFLAIKLEHFEHISNVSDLAKLYTHTLPSTKTISDKALVF
ncbi:hypothetical protein [Aeromonas veronii]|jgi:hypothetical protein|uniref:hypothetical protein n=1 Tax=Aeromonas veronii TaxID=654 RepID=UPI002B4A619B|nr:hypothetical protein [Aeromonas veronii]